MIKLTKRNATFLSKFPKELPKKLHEQFPQEIAGGFSKPFFVDGLNKLNFSEIAEGTLEIISKTVTEEIPKEITDFSLIGLPSMKFPKELQKNVQKN